MMILLTISIKVQAGGTLELAASGPSETQCFSCGMIQGDFLPLHVGTHVYESSPWPQKTVFPCIWGCCFDKVLTKNGEEWFAIKELKNQIKDN